MSLWGLCIKYFYYYMVSLHAWFSALEIGLVDDCVETHYLQWIYLCLSQHHTHPQSDLSDGVMHRAVIRLSCCFCSYLLAEFSTVTRN